MKSKTWLLRLAPRLLVTAVLLASVVMPILPPQKEAKAAPSYPILPAGLNYYQTIFPAGLVYSDGWYGTFTNAPKAQAILLFDDDYLPAWGRAIFAMSPAPQKQPSGAQGGTTLTAITRDQANTIIQSYDLSNFTPVAPEILQVMPTEMKFAGTWAGDKLAQKWATTIPPPASSLTKAQRDYLSSVNTTVATKRAQTIIAIRDFDPPRYWVPNTVSGNWSNTVMWANASGNMSGGASVPTNVDNTFFDANSFNSANKTVTVNVAANTLSMNWTGATNTPALSGSAALIINGNFTLITAMTVPYTGGLSFQGASASHAITTAGQVLSVSSVNLGNDFTALQSVSFQDDFNIGSASLIVRRVQNGIVTNNHTITSGALSFNNGDSTGSLTLGTSTINCSSLATTGMTNFTFSAALSTFNISGTGAFQGNSYIFGTVNLNGTAHTITGNNTFAALNLKPAGAQTITATGTTQNMTSMNRTGTGQITINGNWVDASGTNSLDYMTITNSAASGGATFNAVGGSVDGGGNTGWNFPLTIATGAASGVSYDKNGVVSGNFTGTITDMGGSATVGAWFDYGLTIGYGSTTANTTYSTTNFTGTKTRALPTNLTPGQTYHFRRAITSGANTTYGSNDNFILTMPSVTTGAASYSGTTATLNGNVTNMGVASNTYVRFNWGYSANNLNKSTALQTINGISSFTAGIIPLPQNIYYQSETIVGAVSAYGTTESFTPTSGSASGFSLAQVLPIIAIILIITFVIGLSVTSSLSLSAIITIAIAMIISLSITGAIQAGIITVFGG